ncbi:hypothetical protein JKF63_00108 [Porcisia hertigi]|uniref:Inositol polyphosphate-related phosphatase domain-containing protein n=1 Tax=Porcisia hertigi TaxID=2761500 RepID=A0A836HCJ2_9TRYP|nr:hypothetical protein JKF63_00108 [Porcisia hertigi]
MEEYDDSRAVGLTASMKSRFPPLPPLPTDQTSGTRVTIAPLGPRSAVVRPKAFPGLAVRKAGSSSNLEVPLENPNLPVLSDSGSAPPIPRTPLVSSPVCTSTGKDEAGGVLSRGLDDLAPLSSPPALSRPIALDRSFRDPVLSPPQPSAGTGTRQRVGLAGWRLQRNGDRDRDRHLEKEGEGDGAVPLSSLGVSIPPRLKGCLNDEADQLRMPTASASLAASLLVPNTRAAPSHSEKTAEDLTRPQSPHRLGTLPSSFSRDSVPAAAAERIGDDPVNAAQQAVGALTDRGALSDDAIPNGLLGSASVDTPGQLTVEAYSPASADSQHHRDMGAMAERSDVIPSLDDTNYAVRETFSIPRFCPDDLLSGHEKMWVPGKPLRIAYITWNMASKGPRTSEVSAYCIHPNAHLVVVGTQENGPYVVSNKLQRRWTKTVSQACLGGQYDLVGKHHMWAVQMLVFARRRDVASYVSRVHASHVKTGLLNGLGGNKGGVAVGLALSLQVKEVECSKSEATTRTATNRKLSASSDSEVITTRMTSIDVATNAYRYVGRSLAARPPGDDTELTQPTHLSAGDVALSSLNPEKSRTPNDLDDEDVDIEPKRDTLGDSSAGHLDEEDDTTTEIVDDITSSDRMLSRNSFLDCLAQRSGARHFAQQHPCFRCQRGQHVETDVVNNNDRNFDKGTRSSDTPNYMTLLFITAHLAAHQGAVTNRNKDYKKIVCGLHVGRRGPYHKFFKLLLRRKQVVAGGDEQEASEEDDRTHDWEDDSSEEDVEPLRLPAVSAVQHSRKIRRDVTEEFDVTLFGGDLNYRINGTRKAIEYVIKHHRNIRSILINNDQLSLERARRRAFEGFQEGNLRFRPTYKYEVSAGGGVTLDEYNFSHKKNRMPAYCDRILYKKKMRSVAGRIAIRLYTDVPNVRSSDHRPVVALFDVDTRACTS